MWMYAQLEEGVCDLQHQDVWVVVLVADQNGLACSSHAVLIVVLFQSLQTRKHRRILLRLAIFGAECVVAERIQPDCLGLVRIEVLGQDGTVQSQLIDT